MTRGTKWLAVSALPLWLLGSCGPSSDPIDGPLPTISGVTPDLVCVTEADQTVEVSGDGFAPFIRNAATDDAEVVIPAVWLVLTHDLAGNPIDAGGAWQVPDSEIVWTSQQRMAVTLQTSLELPVGVYRMEVKNASGHNTAKEKAVTVVGKPSLEVIDPDAICSEQAARTLLLTGQGFLVVDGALPVVQLGSVAIGASAPAGCFTVDGPTAAVEMCTDLTVEVAAGQLPEGMLAVTVTNPEPAACQSSEPLNLLVVPPPVVSSVNPDLICLDQESALVTISGEGFIDRDGVLPTVVVGALEIPALSLSQCEAVSGIPTATQRCGELVVELPAGSLEVGPHDVAVRNPEACDCESEEAVTLAVVPAPQIDAVEPSALCAEQQGVTVTLRGVGFLQVETDLPEVTVAGETIVADGISGCTAVEGTLTSAAECTEVEFTLPAAARAAGPQDIVLTNPTPAGCSTTAASGIYLLAAPQIEAVGPTAPCDPVPTDFTIAGQGFLRIDGELPAVTVEGQEATTVEPGGCSAIPELTSTEICTSLRVEVATALTLGAYTVEVLNPGAGSCAASMEGLLGPPPQIATVEPMQLCSTGGNFTVEGSDFAPGAVVSITAEADPIELETTFASPTSLHVVLPDPTPPALYDVTVTNPDGCTDTLADALDVTNVPVVYFVDPSVIYNGITLQATIYTSGILGTVRAVEIYPTGDPGAAVALDYSAADPDKIQTVVPAGLTAGSYDVVVRDDIGCEGLLEGAVDIVAELTVGLDRVELPFGWTEARTGVNIYAPAAPAASMTNFHATPRFYLNPTDAGPDTLASELLHVAFVSATRVSATVPAGLPVGTYDLIAQNPDGGVGLLTEAFRVTALPPPVIFELAPASIVNQDAQSFTILGDNFRTSEVTATCYQPSGSTVELAPVIDADESDASTLEVGIDFTSTTVQDNSLCIVKVTNTDDDTYALYSALGVTNPSLNLAHFASTSVMHRARRAVCAAAGEATPGARFVYAIGGDSGDTLDSTADPAFTYHDSVEMAAVDPYGDLGGWIELPYTLPEGRSFHACTQIGRYVYAIGGNGGAGAQASVWRAQLLDPAQAPEIEDVRLDIDPDEAALLEPGRYSYRVAAVQPATHPDNPGGQTLAGDAALIQTPDIEEKVSITISWSEVAGAVGYRVYRTPAPNLPSGEEVLLAEVEGGVRLFTDDGSATPGADSPLPLGALGRFATMASLNTPREGAAIAVAADPVDATVRYIYLLGGRDDGAAGLNSIEYLQIDLQPDGTQVAATAWVVGGADIGGARWQLGAFVASAQSAPDLVAAGDTWIYAGGGYRANLSGKVNDVVALKVEPGGALGEGADAQYDVDSMQPFNAGYVGFLFNHQLFVFGGNQGEGTDPSTESFSIEMCGLAGGACSGTIPDPPDLANWNNVGIDLSVARYLHGGVTASAFVFLIGGLTDEGDGLVPTATTGQTLW